MGCDGIAKFVFFKVSMRLFGNVEVVVQAKQEAGEVSFIRIALTILKIFDDVLIYKLVQLVKGYLAKKITVSIFA